MGIVLVGSSSCREGLGCEKQDENHTTCDMVVGIMESQDKTELPKYNQ